MTRTRLLLIMIAVLLWPTQAHAANGFWGWLEELSGPGPFKGWLFSTPVACRQNGEWTGCDNPDLRNLSHIPRRLMLRVSVFESPEQQRFKDLPKDDADNVGRVYVVPITVVYAYRPHRTVDIGPGVGFMRFSGDGFKPFYRLTLTPVNASIRPLVACRDWEQKWWARIVRFELDTTFITEGFDGGDFGNFRTTFRSGAEFVTKVGFVLDFGDLFWK